MTKPPLKTKFEFANILYQLMYIPGLPGDADPRYAVAPSTDGMRTVNAGVNPVEVPDVGKRFMSWRIEELPTIPGFSASPRLFLFLRMGSAPVEPSRLDLRGMVCYAMQPVQAMPTNPIQAITDILFGKQEEPAPAQEEKWVEEMFNLPKSDPEQQQETEEGSLNGGEA